MKYDVKGMSCAACVSHVEKAVCKVEGVQSVEVSLLTNSMEVQGECNIEDVINSVKKAGYEAMPVGSGINEKNDNDRNLAESEVSKLIKRLLTSAIFLILIMYITMGHNMLGFRLPILLNDNYIGLAITQMLLAIIVMMINSAFFKSGTRAILNKTPNMDTLVTLGSVVSFLWSLYVTYNMTYMIALGKENDMLMDMYHNNLYFETAAMIPTLITVGKLLEAISKGKTTDAIKELMKMNPKKANVLRNGKEVILPISEVVTDDICIVKSGEVIPADGIIVEGSCVVDESALTGESIPVDKSKGDSVSSATMNLSGYIKMKAKKVGDDTAFSKIIQMVTKAASTKPPIAKIADKVSSVFVPSVISIAVIVFIIWILNGKDMVFALERAISVLVVSCPCALGLATPVAIMAGNGKGARGGILFKSSDIIENAGKTKVIALDKTGTITKGKPEVSEIYAVNDENELMKLAYSLEIKSEHPLAKAIVTKGEEMGIEALETNEFTVEAGNGIRAVIDKDNIYAGSFYYVKRFSDISEDAVKIADNMADKGMTPVYLIKNNKLLGIIGIADVLKEDSIEAVSLLKKMNMEVVMITGDNERTASYIAKQAGIDKVYANVLPEGKQDAIKELKKTGKVTMVGDGINDAVALTVADTGIAIGCGTDVAIESAGIVLVNSNLTDAYDAIRLSKAILRNIYENLFWAFAYNIILIPMAAGLYKNIHMNPMWGAAAMSISSFTVCMNALRLNMFRYTKKNNQITDIIQEKSEVKTMTKKVKIEGMMCSHCENSVNKALLAIDGIENCEASHENNEAVITLSKEVDEESIKNAIEEKD
ncbi:MAG: heavy metal translocating P-type ATPase, partial [Lachnospiraceae bacterium]|nr:heavy metal translocating P-type ATPase [Lachnospiraceae bacterium]